MMTASEWASEAGRATLTRQPRFAARKAARSVGRLPSLVPRITHARTPALDVISGNFFQKVLSRACMFDLVIQQARIAAQQQGDNCKRAMDWLRTFLNDRGYYSKLSLFATYLNSSNSSILCQERQCKRGRTFKVEFSVQFWKRRIDATLRRCSCIDATSNFVWINDCIDAKKVVSTQGWRDGKWNRQII